MIKSLYTLINSLPPRRRTQLLLLLVLMLIGGFAEVLSLGAIVPFLAFLADPVQAMQKPLIVKLVDTLRLSIDVKELRWQFTVLFAGTAIVAGIVRFVLIYAMAKINFGIGHELGAEVFRRTLYQPYEVHVARNSSEIMGGLNKVDSVVWVISGLLNTCSAIFMAVFIIATLVLIDPLVATSALIGFGSIYALVTVFSRKRLGQNSRVINSAYNTRAQSAQEGLGGIRDILLDHTQDLFVRRYNKIDWTLRQAQASNYILAPSPRFAVEALGMVLIALLGYQMTSAGGGIASAIPILGALALGAQRLMPLLQMIYQGWAGLAGNRHLIIEIAMLLKQDVAQETQVQIMPFAFEREIRLKKLSFRYQPTLPMVLHELDLVIPKGTRVGFIGTTGSGKSTLMDLLMGLLQPSSGQILADNTVLQGIDRLAWQSNIAHVPQTIFLADLSFAENIAFGLPIEKIDWVRVRQAAQQAQIAEFIESSAEGYQTMVGERGVRLSGGQRQRIGIARALYKQARVLVFDEATSALDNETEAAVMESIANLGSDLTIILIAHRLTTLQNCDKVYKLEKGRVVSSGTYQELLEIPVTINDEKEETYVG